MPFIPYAVVNDNPPVEENPIIAAVPLQWYAADQETGRADTDHLTTITDRSGNGYHLTGGTGPQWRNAANGIFGLPAYEFAAGREVSGSGRILPLNNFVVYIVWLYTSGRPIGLENDGSGTHGLALFGGVQWIIRQSGATFDLNVTASNPTVNTLKVGGGIAEVLNGYQSVARADLGAGGYTDASVNFTLGSSGNGASDLVGKVAELVTFDRRLNHEEWYHIHGYLRDKYSI